MKIATSLPDPLAHALAEPMEKRQKSGIRERLNAVYGSVSEGVEPAIQKAQLRILDESAYLLRSPKNARRLHDSIAELSASRGSGQSLSE